MPLFRVYKDIFECVKDGSKKIEVRNRLIRGSEAVFMCGREVIRKKITDVKEFSLNDGFLSQKWKMIVPKAGNENEAKERLLNIFPDGEKFYAYFIE
ncbi:MAG TPA: hypothetical protein VJH34_02235 [archaeon]|nr:hypothetical protein [archaeon]